MLEVIFIVAFFIIRISVYIIFNLVLGQSFMLHQIRKMVGVIIAICRGVAKHDVIERAWQPDRLDLPIAPGLGLVLEEVHYDKYNEKFGNDGMHERLDFVELNDQVSEFRAKYILPTIIKVEKEESSYPLTKILLSFKLLVNNFRIIKNVFYRIFDLIV